MDGDAFSVVDTIAMFELTFDGSDVHIVHERHYRLTKAGDIDPTDLEIYHSFGPPDCGPVQANSRRAWLVIADSALAGSRERRSGALASRTESRFLS